ncbi:MAG: Ig-like domain-containing protein, partial [Duncaniella sp.]|nr:Ig-like domain-containing protein [Duncaniella sp.]
MKTTTSLLAALVAIASPLTQRAAEQTTVAHWEFTTGYDEVKEGKSAVYTPNDGGWAASANQSWSTLQPYFQPNSCALNPEACLITVHTSNGKWQLTTSGSTPSYLLRLNTASTTEFTPKSDYTDGTKHDQYFEIAMPTTSLTNVKLNFAIGDGSSSSTPFGVVYSTDGGNSWTVLKDYVSASHWNSYEDATYTLNADNKESLIVRLLIQSATKTSNYNLKYVNILADDFKGPELMSVTPADGATGVMPTGKVTLLFNESVTAGKKATARLTNNVSKSVKELTPTVSNNKVTYAYADLDLETSYTFSISAGAFTDLAGNESDASVTTTFTTSDKRPVPPPVLDSKDRLWYNRPAACWEEALPLGNGRLGAMV